MVDAEPNAVVEHISLLFYSQPQLPPNSKQRQMYLPVRACKKDSKKNQIKSVRATNDEKMKKRILKIYFILLQNCVFCVCYFSVLGCVCV